MTDDVLRAQLAEESARISAAAADLVRLSTSIDRYAQTLHSQQVQLDGQAQRLGRLETNNPEALAVAREALATAKSTRDRVDLALGVLELHGTALEVIQKSLYAQGGMLKRLLATRTTAKPKPRLRVVRGGRATPAPAPKRRG